MKTLSHPSTNGISVLSAKSPVVATHTGSFNQSNAKLTIDRYQIEALTYVRASEITAYQQRLLNKILSKKTAIGCVVAPFGYGKTSTAIDTWKACEERRILAVPPFSCGSISEMGHAIATGIAYRLGLDSIPAQQVMQNYNAYLISSAQRLAEQDANQYQIDFNIALRSIEDKIERGYLNIEATGNHLLAFLEQLTQIVKEAGYEGLLVIVDEFQQFLGNINKGVITNFRTLVWGLRTRGAVPFGLLITMDPDTERNLSERAGDILHRIKEDGLYLDFSDSYDREFARLLWAQYAENFNYLIESSRIVDLATLDSLGQICERHDLSNGPRTVIDVFQRIATASAARNQPYSPIDLIDDFIAGAIRFDGDRSKIASLVTELTGYEYIKSSPERLRTLKLIAAFPRGCPREVAETYNLTNSYDQLADALRGEVLTELSEGLALIDLQRVGKPQNKLNILLKKYWMQITEEEIIADRAVLLFLRYVVGLFFSPFRNILTGWSAVFSDFQLTSSGSYQQIFEGTFFDEYPQRRICIQACRRSEQIVLPEEPVDIHFIFILQRMAEAPNKSSFDFEARTFTFSLALDMPFGMPLPREIRWIEDYLRPVVLSPGVLLTLIDYIHTHASKIEGITENEILRIATYQQKLNSFLLAMIYNENLFTGLGMPVVSRGEQALRSVIYQIFRRVYPEYKSLITSPQWENLLRAYSEALETCNPLQRQGLEPLSERKADLAARFGLRSHAGFESYVRQFGPLLSLESWSGDQGVIRFNPHPGEERLLNNIRLKGEVTERDLFEIAHALGYLSQETRYLIQFLQQRGYIQHGSETDCFVPARSLSQGEVISLADELLAEVIKIQNITKLPVVNDAQHQIDQAVTLLNGERFGHEELSEARLRLLLAQQTVQQARPTLIEYLRSELLHRRETAYETLTRLQQPLVLSNTGLVLDAHLNGAQRTLVGKSRVIATRFTDTLATIKKTLSQIGDAISTQVPSSQIVDDLCFAFKQLDVDFVAVMTEANEVQELRDFHSRWVQLVDSIHQTGKYIEILHNFTDISTFLNRQSILINVLMEGLSVGGILRYKELYAQYHPSVEALFQEVSTAIKAAELVRTYSPSGMSSSQQDQTYDLSTFRNIILDLSLQVETTFADVVKACALPPEELQKVMLELESDGKLSIHFHRDN